MSDIVVPSVSNDTSAFNTALLRQIVDQAPRLLREGLYLAAVPFEYNVALIEALRMRDDGKASRLVERLAEYSFVTPLMNAPGGMTHALHPEERALLQGWWLREDAAAFRAAHQRALDYWRIVGEADPTVPTLNRVYHELIAAPEAGLESLIAAFRSYSTVRRLAAIDRLLAAAEEAAQRLAQLDDPAHPRVAETLLYLRARLDQLRGNWERARAALEPLLRDGSNARLHPYILRAYGLSLMQGGKYVEAMDYLERSLKAQVKRREPGEERAYTMMALGDANVQLALAARGYQADPKPARTAFEKFLKYLPVLPFPLMIYLTARGLNFWHPDSWYALRSQDWIVARLFGRGAKWYRLADRLLESEQQRVVWGRADARLAWLYLNMGDARQALPRFREVLADPGSDEFQSAEARIGLAECHRQLGALDEAEKLAREAMPVVDLYEANDMGALGEAVLGKVKASTGRTDAAAHFGRAAELYVRMGDIVNATAIAEALERLAAPGEATAAAGTKDMSEPARAELERLAALLPVRRYPARFQHPLLEYFQWAALGMLALLLVLAPMLAVRVQSGSTLQYAIGFEMSPPLQAGAGNRAVELGVSPDFSADILPSVVPNEAGNLILGAVLSLLLLYTAVGIYLILRTRFSTLQAASRERSLTVSGSGVGTGDEPPIPWADVSHVFQSETTVGQVPIPFATTTVLSDGRRRVAVPGTTAFYEPLRARLLQRVPVSARRQLLNHSVFPGGLAWLYLGSLTVVLLLAKAATEPRIAPLLSAEAGLYSLLDLYPFFFVGLVVPPLFWLVIQPLRTLATLRRHRPTALVVAGVTLLFFVAQSFPWLRPWFLQPDILADLTVGMLGAALVAAVIRARAFPFPGAGAPMEAREFAAQNTERSGSWADVLCALSGVAAMLYAVAVIAGSVLSYHHVQRGHAALDAYQARTECETDTGAGGTAEIRTKECPGDVRLRRAIAAYQEALALAPDSPVALQGLGAAHVQQRNYQDAVDDFSRLVELDPTNAHYVADRGVVYATWSGFAASQGRPERAAEIHRDAIADFDHAIEIREEVPEFYLWRGSAYHAVGLTDNARADYAASNALRPDDPHPLANLGWLAFQQGHAFKQEAEQRAGTPESEEARAAAANEFENARAFFRQAVSNSANPPPDLFLALGYAHYELGEALQQQLAALEGAEREVALARMQRHYGATLENWERGVALAPQNPTAYNLRATVYYRLGTLFPDGRRADICSSSTAGDSLRAEKGAQLKQALDDFRRAGELDPWDSFNVRTQAQIHYLLRNCPGENSEEQLKAAIEQYTRALTLQPDSPAYLRSRAQITYALFLNEFQGRNERLTEFHPYAVTACQDYERVLEIAPGDPLNRETEIRVLPMTRAQAEAEFTTGQFGAALETFRCLVGVARTAEILFNAGLAALAAGDEAQAQEWYEAGIALAAATGDGATLDAAIAAIGALSQQIATLPQNAAAIFDALVRARQGMP